MDARISPVMMIIAPTLAAPAMTLKTRLAKVSFIS
jgi:hypothetical protein